MRNGNPALSADRFADYARGGAGSMSQAMNADNVMTIDGAVNKSGILLAIVFLAASFTFNQTLNGAPPMLWIWGGMILGLATGVVTAFKPAWSPVSAPLYAVFQGLFLGGISGLFQFQYPGIAIQAVLGTFGVLGVMLVLYKSGAIQVTDRLRSIVTVATAGAMFFYLALVLLSFFGFGIGMRGEWGIIGLGITLVMIGLAAFNLVIDFDNIERGVQMNLPKHFEWYTAFGLMVTLIWLYIEMLRLIAILRDR